MDEVLKNALVDAWLISNRVNLLMLEELTPEALACTLSARGGRTVGQQLVHAYEVRRSKIENADKELARDLPKIAREQGHDRERLMDAFEKSGEAVAELIRRSVAPGAGGKVKGFRRGIAALVGYFIAHDAHHRGHALLTVKQSKVRRSDELKWGIWAWNKI